MFSRPQTHKSYYLYDLRYILAGYVIGKLANTQLSLCRVVGHSMNPTLQESSNDIVLLWHGIDFDFSMNGLKNLGRSFLGKSDETLVRKARRQLQRGSIYVLWHPSAEYKVIKRVIGSQGDTVITVSSFANQASQLLDSIEETSDLSSTEFNSHKPLLSRNFSFPEDLYSPFSTEVEIPEGYGWVEGDCAAISDDSRNYGVIPLTSITAKAVAIIWPPSRITVLPVRNVAKRISNSIDLHVDANEDCKKYFSR